MTAAYEPPIEGYDHHRDAMLAHAERMLDAGDRLQASEKLWGAAAHAVKVVASARGWHYKSHADAHVLAKHVAALTGNDRVAVLFTEMGRYHQNFYEDAMNLGVLRDGLDFAREFVQLLRDAHESIPLDAPAPTEPGYVRRAARASQ